MITSQKGPVTARLTKFNYPKESLTRFIEERKSQDFLSSYALTPKKSDLPGAQIQIASSYIDIDGETRPFP